MRYFQRISGEEFEVRNGEVTRWACCDCGLVHDIAFVARGDVIEVAALVNNRATSAKRRNRVGKPVTKAANITMRQAEAAVRSQNPAREGVSIDAEQTKIGPEIQHKDETDG